MAVAIDREYGELPLETLDLYRETKGAVASTGLRPINPFGL